MPDRLTTHRCKGCDAVLALIDQRARRERFALWCPDCGRHLVLRPETPPAQSTLILTFSAENTRPS